MLICIYSVYTGSLGLHINKANAKLCIRKRAKGVVCEKFVTYLLADWSNLILHIHDDLCCSEVLVFHFKMFAVGVGCLLSTSFYTRSKFLL